MSRRSPPALPPQSGDPVPVEHDSSDGDGGAWMLDAGTALLNLIYTSPPRLLPPPSAWETMMVSVGQLTPSPPRSPSPLWNFDDEQRLPLQMGPTANCSAAILQAAPQDTSYRIATSKTIFLLFGMIAVKLPAGIRVLEKIFLSHGLEIHMNTETGGSSLAMIESYDDVSDLINCVRINRVRAQRRGPASVLSMEQLAAVICYRAKTFESYGLEIHMNTETGGTSLPMIESYDDDNEIGEIPPLGHFHPEFFSPPHCPPVEEDEATVFSNERHGENFLVTWTWYFLFLSFFVSL